MYKFYHSVTRTRLSDDLQSRSEKIAPECGLFFDMKILQKEFTKQGWLHRQLKREGNIALYHRETDGKRDHYEVIKVQKAKNSHTFPNGTQVEQGDESYPTDRTWGTNGFTLMSLESALDKFKELTQ